MKKIIRLDKYLKHVDESVKQAIEAEISICEIPQDELVIKRVSTGTEFKADEEDSHTSEGYASTRVIDFSGDIVVPSGIMLDIYKNNPLVLFNHFQSNLPIGKAIEVDTDDYGLKVKIQYAVEENPEAKTIYKLVKSGYIRQHSIGFVPLERVLKGSREFEEVNKRLMMEYPEYDGNAERIITKSLLLEISVVTIADNQSSMINEVKSWENGVESLKKLGIDTNVVEEVQTEEVQTDSEPSLEEKESSEVIETPKITRVERTPEIKIVSPASREIKEATRKGIIIRVNV